MEHFHSRANVYPVHSLLSITTQTNLKLLIGHNRQQATQTLKTLGRVGGINNESIDSSAAIFPAVEPMNQWRSQLHISAVSHSNSSVFAVSAAPGTATDRSIEQMNEQQSASHRVNQAIEIH